MRKPATSGARPSRPISTQMVEDGLQSRPLWMRQYSSVLVLWSTTTRPSRVARRLKIRHALLETLASWGMSRHARPPALIDEGGSGVAQFVRGGVGQRPSPRNGKGGAVRQGVDRRRDDQYAREALTAVT